MIFFLSQKKWRNDFFPLVMFICMFSIIIFGLLDSVDGSTCHAWFTNFSLPYFIWSYQQWFGKIHMEFGFITSFVIFMFFYSNHLNYKYFNFFK